MTPGDLGHGASLLVLPGRRGAGILSLKGGAGGWARSGERQGWGEGRHVRVAQGGSGSWEWPWKEKMGEAAGAGPQETSGVTYRSLALTLNAVRNSGGQEAMGRLGGMYI